MGGREAGAVSFPQEPHTVHTCDSDHVSPRVQAIPTPNARSLEKGACRGHRHPLRFGAHRRVLPVRGV